MGEDSWGRNHGEGIIGEASWRRYHGEGIMGEESWRRHLGGILGDWGVWMASGRHLGGGLGGWGILEAREASWRQSVPNSL